MKRITFFTTNAGKAGELRALASPLGIEVVQDRRGYPEIQADSLAEVCDAGADALLASGAAPPFVLEDSGLFVQALAGFPGVYSRPALETIGLQGLLRLLEGAASRRAEFRTDLLWVGADGSRHHFPGVCKGTIARSPAGTGGFGFDPIFIPDGMAKTFAQMDPKTKSAASHRGIAVRAFLAALEETAKA
jgi:XTP/dITP diphosphohydrolase